MPNSWVPLRKVAEPLLVASCPDWIEDSNGQYVPLWLDVLAQVWQGALVLSEAEVIFEDWVLLALESEERRQTLEVFGRMKVVSASDVLVMIETWVKQWREEEREQDSSSSQ